MRAALVPAFVSLATCACGLVSSEPTVCYGMSAEQRWNGDLDGNKHAAPLDVQFHESDIECSAPPASGVFDDEQRHWLQVRVFTFDPPAFAYPGLVVESAHYAVRDADQTGAEDGGPMLVWAKPMEATTRLVCDGVSAAGAIVVVGEVEPSLIEQVGPREKMRDEMAARVDEAGLAPFREKAFTTPCTNCSDSIPAP